MDKSFYRLSFFDIKILAELSSHRSLRSLGRALGVEAPKLTKSLQKIKKNISLELLKTSPHGYILTSEGIYVSHQAQELLKKADLLVPRKNNQELVAPIYTIGSRGFLNNYFASSFLNTLELTKAHANLRFIDLSPEELRETAFDGVLDVALHLESISWPKTWSYVEVGHLAWSFYVRDRHPLSSHVEKNELLKYPWTQSTHWNGRALAHSRDSLDISLHERWIGHEMQTAMTALEIIKHTNQLALLPDIVVEKYDISHQVRSVEVRGISKPVAQVFLSVRSEKVPNKLFKNWASELKRKLKGIQE